LLKIRHYKRKHPYLGISSDKKIHRCRCIHWLCSGTHTLFAEKKVGNGGFMIQSITSITINNQFPNEQSSMTTIQSYPIILTIQWSHFPIHFPFIPTKAGRGGSGPYLGTATPAVPPLWAAA
jgi:hypothetical protein